MAMDKPLVTAAWLAAYRNDPDLVILDCRFKTGGDTNAGREAYAEGHIPGAVYFHLDDDLSGPPGEHGGRHPLPDPAVIAAKLGAAGVGEGVKVVAYDWTGESAARCWFVLRWLGMDEVAVLDGGWNAWAAAGHPVDAEMPRPIARTFTPHVRPELVVTMEEVQRRPNGAVVIDARAGARFAGEPHPLDAKPGHIPGAINRPWQSGFRPDGTYLPPEEQAARFAGVAPEQVIHHCGSGVTACPNLLAMEIAGLRGARLYVGSWSDWTSYPENPVANSDGNARVTRRFGAAPGAVFDAWLDPKLIGTWMFGPALRDEEVVRISVEPHVGGAFSFVVRRQGQEIDHVGQYLQIDRPHRLAFTWGVAGTGDSSRVIVEIGALEAGCAVTLTHELSPEWADYVGRTEAAWAKMLDALAWALA